MELAQRFDPPAFLLKFNSMAGHLESWHRAMSNRFDDSIDRDRPSFRAESFRFNPSKFDPGGRSVEQG
jgi:hypothetical protein